MMNVQGIRFHLQQHFGVVRKPALAQFWTPMELADQRQIMTALAASKLAARKRRRMASFSARWTTSNLRTPPWSWQRTRPESLHWLFKPAKRPPSLSTSPSSLSITSFVPSSRYQFGGMRICYVWWKLCIFCFCDRGLPETNFATICVAIV